MTQTRPVASEGAAYGGFVDALGGVATMVLAVIGLSRTSPELMVAVATIVFGAALLTQGGAMLSEYASIIFPPDQAGSASQFGGGSLSVLFLGGAAGIVLGVLALLGIYPGILTAAAVIVYGGALLLSCNSVRTLHMLKRASLSSSGVAGGQGSEVLANELAFGSAGIQAFAGLAAIVLGILAISGTNSLVLTLVALLALGAALILTGSTLSATVLSFMRPGRETTRSGV
jgi:hypothetical protein